VRGLGHVPSFKNSKLLLAKQRRLITKPEYQKWMDTVIRSFESQLRSALATSGTVTTTARIPLSLIASSLPLDDSRRWIPQHSVGTLLVPKGEEGADIVIERIDHAKNRQREGLPGVAGSEELRGDDREGRGRASPLVGIQTQEQAEPQAAGGLPAEHARAAG
jgi:hypothetical protein